MGRRRLNRSPPTSMCRRCPVPRRSPSTSRCPAGAAIGTTYARFRVDSGGGLSPTGLAADGEVEDSALIVYTAPGFSKSFAPAVISGGGVSTLTFTIDSSANVAAARQSRLHRQSARWRHRRGDSRPRPPLAPAARSPPAPGPARSATPVAWSRRRESALSPPTLPAPLPAITSTPRAPSPPTPVTAAPPRPT